jgi:hypothetical protein
MTTNMVIGGEGLRLVQTVATRDALRRGCCSDAVIDHETVPFRVLVDVARALRGDGAGGCGPYLQDLVRGGGLALRAPTRVKRDPTLERRCVALRDKQEQRKYESMTKDVTNESKTGQGIRMSDVTRELGFGAHVLTLMAACFAGGVVAGRSFAPDNTTTQVVLGTVGMFIAMMVEALLFMLRDART